MILFASMVAMWSGAALPLDQVRLGKAVPNSFAFGAAEVGIEANIFEHEGLDIQVTSFRGDAQLQQALAAGSLDVGLGSGPAVSARRGRRPSALRPCMGRPPTWRWSCLLIHPCEASPICGASGSG
jgi:ABC-type nitrate/sulfonate/bicarbonate transport system substrate-binding protein